MDLQEVSEFFTLDQEDVEINYRVVIHLNETTSVGTYEMKFIINDESQ